MVVGIYQREKSVLKRLFVIVIALSNQIVADNQEKDYSILTDDHEIRLVFEQCTRMTPSFRTSYRKRAALRVATTH